MVKWPWILAVALLSACASYSGSNLKPGEAGVEDVLREMGPPAMRWSDADGSIQLAYPRGPNGLHTFMARIGADGKLQTIRNVLEPETFARILPGMTKDQVLRLLGPSEPSKTAYFKARDELVWSWRYRMVPGDSAQFLVLFDATTGKVRSTMTQIEDLVPGLPDVAVGR